jgi:hypothetical protein
VKARTLAEAFRHGQWHGLVRNYFMAILNQAGHTFARVTGLKAEIGYGHYKRA